MIFDSRRRMRKYVERNWPNHVFMRIEPINMRTSSKDDALEEWSHKPNILCDRTHRRWWFKNTTDAIAFKLRFGGQTDD